MANISVFVRIRPILQTQLHAKQKLQTKLIITPDSKKIVAQINQKKQKVFNFNKIFRTSSSQQQVYQGINIPIFVQKVLDGYHSTIFAYGQTGSGKTYTIDGPSDDIGIIPRTINSLFQNIQARKNNERMYKINISFLQIYNEGIYDLIDVTGKPLKMRWNKHQQFIVQDLFEGQCRDKQDALKWWKKGQKNKIMGAHKMNTASSRSHCILTIRIHSYDMQDPSDILQSKLQIVDLAGSQRHKVTKSSGTVFKEGIQINKSLFTLRQVISSLYESSLNQHTNKHIPYRDSRLTSLLKQSIGGNTYCAMIACLNPTSTHFQESFQTLTYASMASYINNTPIKNIDPKIIENNMLRDQNQQYKNQIKKMADHIQKLTKMLQAGVCVKCSQKNQNLSNSISQKIKTEEEISQVSDGPTGLKYLPRNKNKLSQIQIPSYNTFDEERFTQLRNSEIKTTKTSKNKVPPIQKKTLKTTKQILQSINMIKQLINANTGLRDKIQVLKSLHEKQEKQIYNLMKQNQVLRDRWDMLGGSLIPQQTSQINEAPYVQLQKMMIQEKGIIPSQNRLYSQNSSTSKNTSYNEFLMKNMQKNLKKKKRPTNSYSKPSKLQSFNF